MYNYVYSNTFNRLMIDIFLFVLPYLSICTCTSFPYLSIYLSINHLYLFLSIYNLNSTIIEINMYSAVVLLFYILFTVATMDYEKLILYHHMVVYACLSLLAGWACHSSATDAENTNMYLFFLEKERRSEVHPFLCVLFFEIYNI